MRGREVAEEAGRVGVGEAEGGGYTGQQLLLPLRGQSRQHPLRLLLRQPAHVRRRQTVLQPRQHLHTPNYVNAAQDHLKTPFSSMDRAPQQAMVAAS